MPGEKRRGREREDPTGHVPLDLTDEADKHGVREPGGARVAGAGSKRGRGTDDPDREPS